MKYYFLASYLPEIQREDKKLKYRSAELLGERFHIAQADWEDVELILLKGDLLQIERLLSGKETEVEFTLYGREFWKDQLKSPTEVPDWLSEVFASLASEGFSPRGLDRLYQAYFEFAVEEASNPFLRAYLNFERDLRNILTAMRARRKGLPPVEYLVGEGDLADVLGRSGAEDFGLGKDYPWIDQVVEATTPQALEETLQRIVWETIEEMTEPNHFEFDVVLAYLLKVQILERSLALSEEQGLEIIRRLKEL